MGKYDSSFIASLERLRDEKDRAALARLRRGIGKKMGHSPEMMPYVVPYLHESPRDPALCFLLASIFGIHSEKAGQGVSFGAVFKEVFKKSGESESVEKRFKSILSASSDDIGGHLRHAVSLAKGRGVPVDYYRLFYDLKQWEHPDRFVQLGWARDFWGREKQQSDETPMRGEKE
ncbi:MAG: type I-E CRISPR-associated protein Cse2/CasB [bacterium]